MTGHRWLALFLLTFNAGSSSPASLQGHPSYGNHYLYPGQHVLPLPTAISAWEAKPQPVVTHSARSQAVPRPNLQTGKLLKLLDPANGSSHHFLSGVLFEKCLFVNADNWFYWPIVIWGYKIWLWHIDLFTLAYSYTSLPPSLPPPSPLPSGVGPSHFVLLVWPQNHLKVFFSIIPFTFQR